MLTSNICTSCLDRGNTRQWINLLNRTDLYMDDRSQKQPCAATTRRSRVITRIAMMLALAAVCALIVGCTSSADSKQQKAQAAAPRAVSVAIAPVQKQDVPVYLTGLGAVTAFNTANIKSRVDGQIMRVNFREGQNVKAGESLIEIDPRPYQALLDQMQAQ